MIKLSHFKSTSKLMTLIFLIFGFIFGSIIGQVLQPFFPFLTKNAIASLTPQTLQLTDFFSMTFGIRISLNLANILGMAIAFWGSRRW